MTFGQSAAVGALDVGVKNNLDKKDHNIIQDNKCYWIKNDGRGQGRPLTR